MDLSATGLRIQSIAVLPRDLQLEGELELEHGERLKLRCEVVWSVPPDHAGYVPAEVGVVLIEPPARYLELLVSLFAREE